mmetsp:Transcript_42291/g.64844  ORF Transcript_42291/g.64844 Transcript_42291/m.64844 type:complete len:135 (+) Transcript_42291:521-925(+)
MHFRVPEPQDCQLVSSSVSDRPEILQSPLDVEQTFHASFRRPFSPNGLSDVRLYPNHEYNLTSYFGCYRRVYTGSEFDDGNNPDVHHGAYTSYPQLGSFGCKGTWQAEQGDIIHGKYDWDADEELVEVTQGDVE